MRSLRVMTAVGVSTKLRIATLWNRTGDRLMDSLRNFATAFIAITAATAAHAFEPPPSYQPAAILSQPVELIQPAGIRTFGDAVAISEELAVVTATVPGNGRRGAAFVYDSQTGEHVRRIEGHSRRFFGLSVAISGEVLVVGTSEDDENGVESGSVFVYDARTGALRFQESGQQHRVQFGHDVAVEGQTVIASHLIYNSNSELPSLVFDSTTGSQVGELSAVPPISRALFGQSVAISNGIAAIGASIDDTLREGAGAVYLFDTTTGTQIAQLLPPTADDGIMLFGTDVAMEGSSLVVGALERTANGGSIAHAFLYDLAAGEYVNSFQAEVANTDFAPAEPSVAIGAGYVFVGTGFDGEFGYASGSVTVFDIDGARQPMRFYSPDGPAIGAGFGNTLAISGNSLIVGQFLRNEDTSVFGAAYLYQVIPEPSTLLLTLGLAGGLLAWRCQLRAARRVAPREE